MLTTTPPCRPCICYYISKSVPKGLNISSIKRLHPVINEDNTINNLTAHCLHYSSSSQHPTSSQKIVYTDNRQIYCSKFSSLLILQIKGSINFGSLSGSINWVKVQPGQFPSSSQMVHS